MILNKLTIRKKNINGRNNNGLITIRFRCGGHRKRVRIINFSYSLIYVPGIISTFEYDPSRSSFISLIAYCNGFFSYILAPTRLLLGSILISSFSKKIPFAIGKSYPLYVLPTGICIFNVELYPLSGAILFRSAGAFGKILRHLPNGFTEVIIRRKRTIFLSSYCFCTLGIVSNINKKLKKLYKAGQKKWLGFRPKVRGVAKNPVDHPHGGGEGKSSGGRCSVTPWGMLTKGFRTRLRSKIMKYKKQVTEANRLENQLLMEKRGIFLKKK
jgi:large subunit ribosomal protein L2